jgi:hypothetical protein
MSGTSPNNKDVYLNGELVQPLPKTKLYEKISQDEINKKILEKQKEVLGKKEGGDVKED